VLRASRVLQGHDPTGRGKTHHGVNLQGFVTNFGGLRTELQGFSTDLEGLIKS
jgi:hypothetical protein